jgi:hypothetical protein
MKILINTFLNIAMILEDLKKKYPSDYDLGKAFSDEFENLDDVNEYMSVRIIREYPNYYELGNFIRNEFVSSNL